MSKLRGVLAAAFLVVIIPCAYAQDNGALLEVVAKELPAAAVFNGHGEAITLDLAVRCLQETDRTDEVADALAVGMDLGTVATQLSRRVWNGTYHEYTFADFFRVAFSVLRGTKCGVRIRQRLHVPLPRSSQSFPRGAAR